MAPSIVALYLVIVVQLLIIIALALLARYFAVSPSFGIAGQAAGRLKVWLTFGPRIWTYIDMDHLGDINDILTTPERPGADRWNELMRGILRHIRTEDKFLIYGGLGTPYVTCTIASAYSPGWRHHRRAIRAAGARVAQAKPKDSRGQRGEILEACL
jgi:hypothetical protein